MTAAPRSYICMSCGEVHATLPTETDGRCSSCLEILRLNPYTGIAQMAIEYLRGPRQGFWSPVEVLRMARTMVFILERETVQTAPRPDLSSNPLSDLIKRMSDPPACHHAAEEVATGAK